ncbi:hypothetical protein LTR66_002553 [Elasticomyces elasticus]|nr:hypothetical protein LTR66_002553 [Elasticomyces elasticus]
MASDASVYTQLVQGISYTEERFLQFYESADCVSELPMIQTDIRRLAESLQDMRRAIAGAEKPAVPRNLHLEEVCLFIQCCNQGIEVLEGLLHDVRMVACPDHRRFCFERLDYDFKERKAKNRLDYYAGEFHHEARQVRDAMGSAELSWNSGIEDLPEQVALRQNLLDERPPPEVSLEFMELVDQLQDRLKLIELSRQLEGRLQDGAVADPTRSSRASGRLSPREYLASESAVSQNEAQLNKHSRLGSDKPVTYEDFAASLTRLDDAFAIDNERDRVSSSVNAWPLYPVECDYLAEGSADSSDSSARSTVDQRSRVKQRGTRTLLTARQRTSVKQRGTRNEDDTATALYRAYHDTLVVGRTGNAKGSHRSTDKGKQGKHTRTNLSIESKSKQLRLVIQCDSCTELVSGTYHHCKVYNFGEYDLCMDCYGRGLRCQKKQKLEERTY